MDVGGIDFRLKTALDIEILSPRNVVPVLLFVGYGLPNVGIGNGIGKSLFSNTDSITEVSDFTFRSI